MPRYSARKGVARRGIGRLLCTRARVLVMIRAYSKEMARDAVSAGGMSCEEGPKEDPCMRTGFVLGTCHGKSFLVGLTPHHEHLQQTT